MTMLIQTDRTARGTPAFAHAKHELIVVDGVNENASYDGSTVENQSLQIPGIVAWGDAPGANYTSGTTLTLNAHHLFADDVLIGCMLSITNGTNTEHKIITDNALSGRTVTIAALTYDYTTANSTYKLHRRFVLAAVNGTGSLSAGDYMVLVACVDKSRIMQKVSSTPEVPEDNTYSDQEWYKVAIAAPSDTIRISNIFKPEDTNATHYRVYCTGADGTQFHKIKDVAIDTWDGTQTIDITESETFIAAQPLRHMKHHRIPPTSVALQAHGIIYQGGTVAREGPGTITISSGSRNFTGTSTVFDSAMEGLFIRMAGASALYEIRTIIDATHGIFYEKASEAYTTAAFEVVGRYDTLWRTETDIYTTQAHPEGTDLFNRALEIPVKHGDGIVGGVLQPGGTPLVLSQNGGFQIIRGEFPTVQEVFEIGAAGKNTIIAGDEFSAFIHNVHGIYAATGAQRPQVLSQRIPKQLSDDEINRERLEHAPSMFFSEEGGSRWFVWALAPTDETTHTQLLVYNMDQDEFSIIHGPATTAMGTITDENGIPKPVLGDCFGRLWYLFQQVSSTNKSMGSQTTRRRGLVSSATSTTLTDAANTFYTTYSGEVGVPVAIIAGTGVGQVRLVYSNTATALTVHKAWTTTPDTTSVYQIGASLARALRPPWSFDAGPGALKQLYAVTYTFKKCTPVYSTGKVHLTYGSATVTAVNDAVFPTDGTALAQPLLAVSDPQNIGWISAASATELTLTSTWGGKTGNTDYTIGSKFLTVNMYQDLDDPDTADPWKTVYVPMDAEVIQVDLGVQGNYIQLEDICWDEPPVEIINCEPVYQVKG